MMSIAMSLSGSSPANLIMSRARSMIETGSPMSSTNTSPPCASEPERITSCTASGIVMKKRVIRGPVTVTDPRMTRFFMTIPEAVQLVIRSGSLAQGGEVFVLDMGEPVSIMDLARDMIKFAGLEPDSDIAIDIIGARAGEKLHEELFNAYERAEPTPAAKIMRAVRPAIDPAWVEETFSQIGLLVLEGDAAALAAKVAQLAAVRVPPTQPAERVPQPPESA